MATNRLQPPILETLKEQIRRLECAHRPSGEGFSCGCAALDQLAGFRRGTIVEYLADLGCGAMALALLAAREASREGGALVVIDQQFYPPAAHSLGIDLSNVIFVRPQTQKDYRWALHQSLGCNGVVAVLCWPDKLDDRVYRGLQLAAETSGTVGLFIRPLSVRGHPTWSELQLWVNALPQVKRMRRLRIEVVRCRNGKSGASVELELDDETGTLQESHAMPVVAPMATAAAAHRTA